MVKSGEKACKKYKTLLFRVNLTFANLNRFLAAQLEMNQNALKTITVFAVQTMIPGWKQTPVRLTKTLG